MVIRDPNFVMSRLFIKRAINNISRAQAVCSAEDLVDITIKTLLRSSSLSRCCRMCGALH